VKENIDFDSFSSMESTSHC